MRVLFFAEAVTLAHLARPLALAAGLDPKRFEVAIAGSPSCRDWVTAAGFRYFGIDSIEPAAFVSALEHGRSLYELETLKRYVVDDLRVIEEYAPDVVIGDFRLSLSVSARLARVPYITLTNAYWSPYASMAFPMPVLPLTQRMPLGIASLLFRVSHRIFMGLQCGPVNALRRHHGLPSLGHDLRRVYTDADRVAYADAVGMFPMRDLPDSHGFIGPVSWSPPVKVPPWWEALPQHRPVVYVTVGSSGSARVLRLVLAALAGQDVTVISATAGAPESSFPMASNLYLAPYLPGDAATRLASVVVCNGGSMTSQQAMLLGRPVLGIPSNMDQFMNMAPLVAAGAARQLRADRVTETQVVEAIRALLADPAPRAAAARMGALLASTGPAADRLAGMIDSCLA